MASQTRMSAREEERRLNMRTLVIASAASATAAVVTSQLWVAGTWVAAALTPVIVALVSELLHRPTAVIAERVTSKSSPILPQAAGGGAPPRRPEPELPARAPAEPGSGPDPAEPPVRMYRSGSGRERRAPATGPRRRKIAIGVVALTAVLALAITAIAITGTELVTGGSIGKGERDTTLFGGARDERTDEPAPENEPSAPSQGEGQQEQPSQPQQEGGQQREEPPADSEPAPEAPEAPQAPTPEQP